MPHVFLSYVREDSSLVDRLCAVMTAFDVEVWLDRDRILPGYRWQDAIRTAIQQGAFFVACFSKGYVSRERTYMNEELVLAIDELRKRPVNRAWFIPVLLTPVEVPDRDIGAGESLHAIQWVSLYDDWDGGVQKLLSVISPHSAKVHETIGQLRSASARVRVTAANQLGTIGLTAAKDSIEALVKALKDDHAIVRGVAADSLGKIGIVTDEVVVGLLRMKDDETNYGWDHAGAAFKCFGAAAVPFLINHLDSDRFRASLALRELGTSARDSLPYLISRVRENQNDFIVQALGSIGDRSALPCLLETYKSVRGSSNLDDSCNLVKAIAMITHPGTTYSHWQEEQATEIAEDLLKRWEEGDRAVAI
jgi:hypothetical protein